MSHHSQGRVEVNVPRSAFCHGGFGRICRELPPWAPPGIDSFEGIEDHFRLLAREHMIEQPGASPGDIARNQALRPDNYIQWDWFLPMTTSAGPFPQRARKIDTRLSNAVAALHEGPAGSDLNVLAFRNLLRGYRFDLPAGSALARKLGAAPIDIEPDRDARWYYLLREAEVLPGREGECLGHLGSLIVCATFAGLLSGDPTAWFNLDPDWTPDADPLLRSADRQDGEQWTLAAIIRLAGLPVDASDVADQS